MDKTECQPGLDFSFLQTASKSTSPSSSNGGAIGAPLHPAFPIYANGAKLSSFNADDTQSLSCLKFLKAVELSMGIQEALTAENEQNVAEKAIDILSAALVMLLPLPDSLEKTQVLFWNECSYINSELSSKKTSKQLGGRHYAAPAILVHPDEFKNPSSFLKLYGDPQCKGKEKKNGQTKFQRGVSPKVGYKGNWKCLKCFNVNFPRRFNCLKCGNKRLPADDELVKHYAINVYKDLLPAYRRRGRRGISTSTFESKRPMDTCAASSKCEGAASRSCH